MYNLFGPNQFNHTHKWTVNAATALLWHAIRLRFDKHMSWLVIFCWKGGELPKRLKFEEHVLEQKLVKHVLQHAFGHNLRSPKCLYKQQRLRKKPQCNSMPPRRKLSDLDRGRAIGWLQEVFCTHTLVIRWNHIKIWDHSIQNFVFGTSVNSWSLTYFE